MWWRMVLMVLLVWWLWRDGATQVRDNPIHLTIEEELPRLTIIGDVVEAAGLANHYRGQTLRSLRFRFLSQPNCDVMIEEQTGVLKVKGRIDREALSGGNEADFYIGCRVDVVVQPLLYFQLIKVLIEIVDVNDNSPEFKVVFHSIDVLESTRIGTSFPLPMATDNDSTVYSVAEYRITPSEDSEYFQLVRNEKPEISLKMILVKELDREAKETHLLELVAIDGGYPPRSQSIGIVVVVLDSNDNPPIFERDEYELTIPENIHHGTTILQLSAVDPDTGSNAEVIYHFTDTTADSYGHVFAVDNTSGDVLVIGEVDREKNTDFRLVISAQNPVPDSLSSETVVLISVEDENDNPPSMTINALSGSNVTLTSVPEDAAIGTFVAHVLVSDPDSDENGLCDCRIDLDQSFRLHKIFEMEYQVVTSDVLDREFESGHSLTIECEDGGSKPRSLTSSMTLYVEIDDVNDNAPQFRSSSYSAEVFENNFVGISIATVEARDPDQGNNSMVTYALQGPPQPLPSTAPLPAPDHPRRRPLFGIDVRRGVVTGLERFDHETISQFDLTVMAIDGGNPPRTGFAQVFVRILDVNDEAPRFSASAFSFGIEENLSPGYEVGILRATDRDDPPFNSFSFSLLSTGTTGSDAFLIDERSGKITTSRPLDRELVEIYHLTAKVRDNDNPSLSSTSSVVIHVMDVNDNQPVFTAPTEVKDIRSAVVRIARQTAVGSVIKQVSASDADAGENGDVFYRFNTPHKESFSIDPLHGTIVLSKELDASDEGTAFVLTVIATDRGLPALSSRLILKVMVDREPVHPKYRFLSEQPSSMERNIVTYSIVALLTIAASIFVFLAIYFCIFKTVCILNKPSN